MSLDPTPTGYLVKAGLLADCKPAYKFFEPQFLPDVSALESDVVSAKFLTMSELKVDKSKVLKTQLVKPHKFAPKRQGDIVWETKVHVPELGKDVSLFRYGPNKAIRPSNFSFPEYVHDASALAAIARATAKEGAISARDDGGRKMRGDYFTRYCADLSHVAPPKKAKDLPPAQRMRHQAKNRLKQQTVKEGRKRLYDDAQAFGIETIPGLVAIKKRNYWN